MSREQELECVIRDLTEECRGYREDIQIKSAVIEKLREALYDQLNDCINFDGGKLTDCIMEASTKTLAIQTDSKLILIDWMREQLGEPVAYRFSKGTITKLDSWPHGGNWQPLFKQPEILKCVLKD